jgi:hypothetical protein
MSSKKFTAQIFTWLCQINADRDLPPNAAKVAIALAAKYFNEDEGGAAWAALQTIASDARLAKATVTSMVRRLQEHGHLRVQWGKPGSGHTNRYWMEVKTEHGDLFDYAEKRSTATDLSEPEKRSNCAPPKGQNQGGKRSNFEEKRSTASEQTLLDSPKNLGGEARAQPPDRFAEKQQESGEEERAKNGDEAAAAFAAFWAAYPRHVGEDDARKAFARALKRADAEAIIAGAKRYAAKRAAEIQSGDEPKWTKHPKTWLNGGRWNDEAKAGEGGPPVIDEAGNVVASPPPARRSNERKTWAETADEYMAEVGDAYIH